MPFTHSVPIRYLEVDQQGVVFNMWYLAYVDDAMTAYLDAGGLPYSALFDHGLDVQVVHAELDWTGSLSWGRPADIDVTVERVGTTSFTMAFAVRAGEKPVATIRMVYVVVATDGSGKRPVPAILLDAFERAGAA